MIMNDSYQSSIVENTSIIIMVELYVIFCDGDDSYGYRYYG